MKLYNTLTKKIEEIVPNEEGIIKLYTCGPTVYSYSHLGNMRTYISEDLIEKSLEYLGYKVKRVMNITDVGHLQSDGDTGEDKMSVATKRENKSSREIADFYTEAFFEDFELINNKKPEIVVNATDEIEEYFKIISKLLDNDIAYICEGNVYFDTSKYDKYYKLSGKNPEDLFIAAREGIEEDKNKRNPFDFGLWFTNSKFNNQELKWNSPWGEGYPGWHIECSGIAIKYLGEKIDIHCGAEDAIFPHHTNEIAQSEAYLGHKWCNYWIHLSWLLSDTGKMSKSKGDTIRIKTLMEMGFNPLSYRYFILNTYYHKQVSFSIDNLKQSEIAYTKLLNKVSIIKEDGEIQKEVFDKYDLQFKNCLNEDLNTSNAITLLYELIKDDKVNGNTKLLLIKSWDKVLSLNLIQKKEQHKLHKEIMKKIEERNQAKLDRNYKLADNIREELLNMGIELMDTKEGTTYKVVGD